MKKLLIALAALSLSGCAALPGLLLGAGASTANVALPPPAAVANNIVMDEKIGTSVEVLYQAATNLGTLAFRNRVITPSTNPAVQRDDFCPRIMAGELEPTDTGMTVSALECRLRFARDATRSAYRAGNAADYHRFAAEAISLGREFNALIRGRN